MNRNLHISRRNFFRLSALAGLGYGVGIQRQHARPTYRSSPQQMGAAKAVLCLLLIGGSELIGQASRELTPTHFAVPAHALLFRTLVKMQQSRQVCDIFTLTQKLRDDGDLDFAGGAAGITDIFAYVPSAANYSHYAALLRAGF